MNLTLTERERMAWITGDRELSDALGRLIDTQAGASDEFDTIADCYTSPSEFDGVLFKLENVDGDEGELGRILVELRDVLEVMKQRDERRDTALSSLADMLDVTINW